MTGMKHVGSVTSRPIGFSRYLWVLLAMLLILGLASLARPAIAIVDPFTPDQCAGPAIIGFQALGGLSQPNNPVSAPVPSGNPGGGITNNPVETDGDNDAPAQC